MATSTFPTDCFVEVSKTWLDACGMDSSVTEFEVVEVVDYGDQKDHINPDFRTMLKVKTTLGLWTVAWGRCVRYFNK